MGKSDGQAVVRPRDGDQSWGRRVAGERAAHEAQLAAVVEQAKQAPCADCKQHHPPQVLRFRHRPGVVRRFSIAQVKTLLPSIEVLREELARCDLLCANCDALRGKRT